MYKNSARSGTIRSKKKVFIKTFGCQMNVYDSERMTDVLEPVGYDQTDSLEDADLVVLNTCHIREKAAEKVYSELGRIKLVKSERSKSGKDTLIAVAGCVAQAEGKEIINRAPVVDLVVGPQSYHRLPDLIFRARQEDRQIVYTEFPEDEKFDHMPPAKKRNSPVAFLTVQEGCDKFCTFCVVPYTRGVEFSRSVEQVRAEARRLVDTGVREITLLGQNVNAYHGESTDGRECSLAELIAELTQIEGLDRLRYTTSHPKDMNDALINAHRDIPQLMPYLHLPFQAGSNRILAAMNRKHTTSDYLAIIEKLRKARPDIALSTDIIVGFPGESDQEFQATLDIVRTVKFSHAFSFKYSPRPGTPAASMEQVPEEAKSERLQILQELITRQQTEFNYACIGQTVPVLFEKPGRNPGQMIGRSPYLQAVYVENSNVHLGEIKEVEIQSSTANSLKGVIKSAKKSDTTVALGGDLMIGS